MATDDMCVVCWSYHNVYTPLDHIPLLQKVIPGRVGGGGGGGGGFTIHQQLSTSVCTYLAAQWSRSSPCGQALGMS